MRIHISHLLFCAITIWFLTLESNSRSFCKYILMCKHAFVEVKWVKSSKITELSYLEFLPSPSRALSEKEAIAITAANNPIESLVDSPKSSPSRPWNRKRGGGGLWLLHTWTTVKICKFAEEVGVINASRRSTTKELQPVAGPWTGN